MTHLLECHTKSENFETRRAELFQSARDLTYEFARHVAIRTPEPTQANTKYGQTFLCKEEQLSVQARFKNIEDIYQDFEYQFYYVAEVHPWFRTPVPRYYIVPMIVIEYDDYYLTVTNLDIELKGLDLTDKESKLANLRERLAMHRLRYDESDQGHNVGIINEEDLEIFDLGALRPAYQWIPERFDAEAVAREKQLLADFHPLPPRQGEFAPQIRNWCGKGYNLRDIYERGQSFADQTGGKVVMAANPGIVKNYTAPTP